MKPDSRRYAFLGLILSGLSVISFLVILIIKGLAAANIFQPTDPQTLNRSTWISLAVFTLGFALTSFLDPERTRKFIFGRQAQHGSNAIITLVAFLGILIFLNILAFQNPKSWDLSESKQNTLAPETIAMLKALPEKVNARAYFSTRTDSIQARKLLENFKQLGMGNFSYEFIDPDTNPVAAKQDGVDRDGTVILIMGEHREPASYVGEEEIDIALVKLINPKNLSIYFLTGHGEADIQQSDDASYSLIRTSLENKNYTVNSLNLATNKIPGDARVILVPGPQTPLSTDEVAQLQAYLDKGGSLIVMENPRFLTKFGEEPDPLATILTAWGINSQNDILYDPNANPPLLVYADPLNYGQHTITNTLRGVNSRFFTSQSLVLNNTTADITLTPLAQTYPEAWGETNFASIENNQVANDIATDIPGPLVLSVAGENASTKGRLVVFGDSEFAANALYKVGNGEILLNSIDWAAQQEKLISLTPKNNPDRTYTPPGSLGLIAIILVSLCALPLLIIAGGITTWYARRKRG